MAARNNGRPSLGRTIGRLDFHGDTIPVEQPRVRGQGGEFPLPSWESARSEDWLGRWAMNLMLMQQFSSPHVATGAWSRLLGTSAVPKIAVTDARRGGTAVGAGADSGCPSTISETI